MAATLNNKGQPKGIIDNMMDVFKEGIEGKGNIQQPGTFLRSLVSPRPLDATTDPKSRYLPKEKFYALKFFSESILILNQELPFNF